MGLVVVGPVWSCCQDSADLFPKFADLVRKLCRREGGAGRWREVVGRVSGGKEVRKGREDKGERKGF